MKRLEAKYTALHLVPLIERLGTPQVGFLITTATTTPTTTTPTTTTPTTTFHHLPPPWLKASVCFFLCWSMQFRKVTLSESALSEKPSLAPPPSSSSSAIG